MTYQDYTPSVIDFAYEIIHLHEENERLHYELEHYKKMLAMADKSLKHSDNHTKEMIDTLLTAALDPGSVINKGQRAIIEEQMEEPS